MSAGDIVILVASTIAGATMSITANGSIGTWNAIGTGHQDVTGGEHLYAWWGVWSSGTTGPTVTPTSDHACAGTMAYYNANTVNPIDVVAWSSEATSDTSYSHVTGLTSTVNLSMVISICSSGYDSTTGQFSGAATNASLTSITRRLNYQTNSNGGGGFGVAEGVKAAAGTCGTWASTLAQASPKAYVCFVLKPPTDTTLTVSECFHGSTDDTAGALTQVHNLTPSEAFHGLTSDGATLTQVHKLTVQEAAHALTDDGPLAITQEVPSITLTVAECFHGLTSDAVGVMVQNSTLTVAEAAHAQSADAPALTQAHRLTVAEAAHAQSADGATLTQVHNLTIQEAAHALASDAVGVMTQNSTLVVSKAYHGLTSDTLTLTQVHTLAGVAECRHTQSADGPLTLQQVHNLSISDARHLQAAESPALTQAHTLAVADAAHAQSAECAAITQVHYLTIADARHALTSDSPAPYESGGTNTVLTVQRAVHQQRADSPARLIENSVLAVAEAFHSTSSDGALVVTQNFTLAPADCRHAQTADAAGTLAQVHRLTVADARHVQTAASPALVQQYILQVSDCAHAQRADQVTLPFIFGYFDAAATISTRRLAQLEIFADAGLVAAGIDVLRLQAPQLAADLTADRAINTRHDVHS